MVGLLALAVACGSRIERNPPGASVANGGSSSNYSQGDDDDATGVPIHGQAGSYADAGAAAVGGTAAVGGAASVAGAAAVAAGAGGDENAAGGGDSAAGVGGTGGEGGAGGEPNDHASIIVSAEPHLVVHEWYGEVTFSLVLSERPRRSVAVPLESSDTAHARVTPETLVFTPDDWNVPHVATVKAVDDVTRDNNHPVLIRTLPAESDDPRYDGIDADDVPVLVFDDTDVAVIVSGTNGVTTEDGGSATFRIVLGSKPTATVSFSLSSSDPTEGTVQPRVEIEPADWAKPHVVTVFGANDNVADGDQPYQIIVGAAESADPAYAGLSVPNVSFTNIDNDS